MQGNRVVGIDLAKRTYVAKAIETDTGKESVWNGSTDARGIGALCKKLRATDRVGLECCSLGFYVAKVLIRQVGCTVLVLNPGQLAIIYRTSRKTDLIDAGKLAWILNRFPDEELPTVKLPTDQEEHRRAMMSEVRSKKQARTALVNRLHSLFVRQGIVTLTRKDFETGEARERHLKFLTGYTVTEAKRILEEIELLESHIEQIEIEIKQELVTDPLAPYLLSIPGVGTTTAMAFLAFVGDGSRFSSGRQVSHFAGMTPRVDASGETTRIGHIGAGGCKAIKSVIIQSAWAAVHAKKSNSFKSKYLELVTRRGKGRAIVAVARRMIELMWTVVCRKEFCVGVAKIDLALKLARIGLKMEFVGPGT